MSDYNYEPHPHVASRKHPKERGLQLSRNQRVGLWITTHVGTMWAAYLFFGLALVSLPAALASGSEIVIVSWVAQTFLQLVLLPIIIVGQNIQAKASEARAVATYEDAGAILAEAKAIQEHLGAQDARVGELVKMVEGLVDGGGKK